jgi:excinuclease UvrABC nuclease subunit
VEVEVTGFINASEMLRSGVYMLVRAGEVVYIGQAKAMIVRVCTHRSNARKTLPSWMPPSAKGIIFDEVLIRPCPVHLLDSLEYDLINLYKPRHNIALKHNGKAQGEVTITVRGTAVTLNRKPDVVLVERRI